jgi:hypothetical protein
MFSGGDIEHRTGRAAGDIGFITGFIKISNNTTIEKLSGFISF